MNTPPAKLLPARHTGFTLLELIIALSLTVMITLAVFSALHLAVRAADKGNEHSERTNEIRVVRDWIRRQFERATPILVEQESGEAVAAFWGGPGTVRFIAPLPAHLGGGGLSVVTFDVKEGGTELRLVVEHQLYHPEITPETHPPKQTVLLDAIRELRFRFYGTQDEDEAPRWHDRWEQMKHLPSLVSLAIGFEEGSAREWITLIAAPMIDGKALRGTLLVNGQLHDRAGT